MKFSISSEGACLKHYKSSLRGKVEDFVIRFNACQKDIRDVIKISSETFKMLIEHYSDKEVYARLVAKVSYLHCNVSHDNITTRSFYFTSYATELVTNPEDFFERHLLRIGERLQTFHENGSNLILNGIDEIHIHLTWNRQRRSI